MSKNKCFVNLPMLDRFTAYHRKELRLYARMLRKVKNVYRALFYNAIKDTNTHIEAAIVEIDDIAATLDWDDSYGTGNEYLMVNDFLDGLRCGIVSKGWRYQGIEFKNDHSMVETIIGRAALEWKDLRKQYGGDTKSVAKIFRDYIGDDIGARFPDVNTLYALLAAEYAKAREILLAQPEMP